MLRATSTTEEILTEIGYRLRRYRLQQNRTLAEVAAEAGVGVRTLVRAEGGEGPTLATIVRVLRALGRLEAVEAFLPAPIESPLRLAELGGRVRRRAGSARRRSPREGSDTP